MLNCYLYHAGGVRALKEQREFASDEIEFIKKCMADEIALKGEAQLSQFYGLNQLLDRIAQLKEELLGANDKQKNKHSVAGYKPILNRTGFVGDFFI